MTFNELLSYLFEISDSDFAAFSKSLSNSSYISIGVKNPILRRIIKNHINDLSLTLSDFQLGKYLEIDFIYFGLALCRLNKISDQLLFLSSNIKKAKSWAITDCVVTYLKKSDFATFFHFFKNHYQATDIYEKRFCYVFALKHAKNSEILQVFPYISVNEDYMVMMAEAWLLATVAIYFPDDVYEFLDKTVDIALKRKTISKICDSFRIEKQTKEKFKRLRQNP